jgi:hypothetical protein
MDDDKKNMGTEGTTPEEESSEGMEKKKEGEGME